MAKKHLELFTDRREALALFTHFLGRNPDGTWPLLPILAFLAPGGSGKSTLIEYLRVNTCCLPDGRAALPYAHLDFTNTPKDLLSILIALRDELQQHDNGQGGHLTFPRFDLGVLTAQSSSTHDASSFTPTDVKRKFATGKQAFEALTTLGSSLGATVPLVAPLLAGLNLAGQIKPVHDLLSYLEDATGWRWYRTHGTTTGLGANASMKEVLRRLQVLSLPGRPERELFVHELLPAAFLADLLEMLPRTWTNRTNVVFFLDGFEALQRASEPVTTALLHVLTIEQRKQGTTDPLLLVVGSRDPLPGQTHEEHPIPFERTALQEEHLVQQQVRELVADWQGIPKKKRVHRVSDLYLPLVLCDFGPEDTHSYLLTFGERRETQAFAQDKVLVQTIEHVTHGHPLFLALAAEAVLEAEASGRTLTPNAFLDLKVSPEIDRDHQEEQIGTYLLDLFLRQRSETEQKELVVCAFPRFLDAAVLHVLLPSLDDMDVQQRWKAYRRLTFMSALDEHRLVFHPLVRTLLLRHLPPDQEPDSDYARTRSRLREHFQRRASRQLSAVQQGTGAWQAPIEEAYHALALGDPQPAITLGIHAQQTALPVWEPLVEAVMQAPTGRMPASIEEQAYHAVVQVERHHDVADIGISRSDIPRVAWNAAHQG